MSLWLNRTMCDVLEDMRKLTKTVNCSTVNKYKETMSYLIEEVQTMGNRMEAALNDKGDIESIHEEWLEKKHEYQLLQKEVVALKEEKGKLLGDLEDES